MSLVGRLKTSHFSRRNRSVPANDPLFRKDLPELLDSDKLLSDKVSSGNSPHGKLQNNDVKIKPFGEFQTFEVSKDKNLSPTRKSLGEEMREDECVLNDPELPLVVELDHKVGKCFCHLCECGKHICPGNSKLKQKFTKGNFLTSYKVQYDTRENEGSLNSPIFNKRLQTQGSPRRPDLKMDLITIKQQDFQLPINTEQSKPVYYSQATTTHDLKFTARTGNQVNYPNWGPNEIERMRHSSLPYRGQEIKFNSNTTYGSEFRRSSISRDEYSSRRKTLGGFDLTSRSPISPSKNFFSQTTSGLTYQDHKNSRLPTRKMMINEEYTPVVHSPRHFDTIYRNQFIKLEKSARFSKKLNE